MAEVLPPSVYAAFKRTAEAHPQNSFLCVPIRSDRAYAPDGLELSYSATAAIVDDLAAKYAAAGYGIGHRVGLLLDMRPEFFFHYLALNALGCGVVPINPDYRHDEMLYQMQHSEADLVVSVPHRVADLQAVAKDRAEKPLPVLDCTAIPAIIPSPQAKAVGGSIAHDTECTLLYTSGTTGRPKGCILSNFYVLNAGDWYRSLGGMLTIRPGQDRIYNPLPLFHMNHGAVTATCAMLTANCLILTERFSPTRWWQEVVQTRATIIHYLGIVPPLLLNQPETPEEKQHSVRFGLGAGVEPQLHGVFEQRYGFPLIEVWGMTETGRIFADCHAPRQIDTRAFGRPLPGLEAMVAGNDGREVPCGQEGELLVRCSAADPRRGFFSGYLKNDKATEDSWAGGWFHTGDVVRQSEDGMLYFVDRMKNIIRRSGENIAAAEIEACLQAHEAVAQVAVLAAPDEIREEEVMACIVPMSGQTPTPALAEALFTWCFDRLAYFKAPGWLLFVDSLPTTGTQKVQKTQIFKPGEDPRQRPGIYDFRGRKKR
ncbi:MAG: AMP-binding protein [Ferrovibrio sp.]|uniref:AMP-binding protein n=1 Tax=Ferrovibrio sp. TaxID=1917215 RepID=UPI002636C823|nr:AMP-binding protein [Ferrovibrio sp.]MCW0233412.1 AMP-binding protein [Ferrovibrio sp.]